VGAGKIAEKHFTDQSYAAFVSHTSKFGTHYQVITSLGNKKGFDMSSARLCIGIFAVGLCEYLAG
jgi:hypothetical protein